MAQEMTPEDMYNIIRKVITAQRTAGKNLTDAPADFYDIYLKYRTTLPEEERESLDVQMNIVTSRRMIIISELASSDIVADSIRKCMAKQEFLLYQAIHAAMGNFKKDVTPAHKQEDE